MKTADFLRQHGACSAGAKWALSVSADMGGVWDAMVAQDKHVWLMWTVTRRGVFDDSTLRRLACRFVRETPLDDGRKVWDLLTDARSRAAVEVAERHAAGLATDDELAAARAAAWAAARAAAWAAARDAARAAARDAVWAAWDAAWAAARDAARDAQVRMIADLGNPFRKAE